MKRARKNSIWLAVAAVPIMGAAAQAADRYWTGGSTDNAASTQWSGSNSIWGTTSGSGGTAGTPGSASFSTGDNAIFEGIAATVALGSLINAGAITLGGYTLNLDNNTAANGGGFNLSATDLFGNGTITNTDTTARTVTLSPTLNNSGNVTLSSSAGVLNLVVNGGAGVTLSASVNGNGSGNNTVSVASGTLKLTGGNSSSRSTITQIASGAYLDLNSKTWYISSTASTSGTVTNSGGSEATLQSNGAINVGYLVTGAVSFVSGQNTNTFSGAINDSSFRVTSASSTSNSSSTNPHVIFTNAVQIGSMAIGTSSASSGNSSISRTAVELNSNNMTAGNASLTGVMNMVGTGSTPFGRVYSALLIGGDNVTTGNVTFTNGVSSAANSSTNAGSGLQTSFLKITGNNATVGNVAMNNTYAPGSSGNTSITTSARLELVGSAATIGNLTSGGTAVGNNVQKLVILGNPTGGGSASTLTLNTSGDVNVFAGTITDGTTTATNTTFAGSSSINASAGTTSAGAIGSIIKSGTGVLSLSGTNNYTGGTSVTGGTLVFVTTASKPASGGVTVSAAGGLGLGVSTGPGTYFTSTDVDDLWSNSLSGVSLATGALVGIDTTAGDFTYSTGQSTRGLVKTGANILTLAGTNTYGGGTKIVAGTLRGDTASLQGAIVNNSVLNFEQASDGAFAGTVSGSGNLTKTGLGGVTLASANTYTGTTSVTAGTLALTGSLTGSNFVVNGGKLSQTSVGNISGATLVISSGSASLAGQNAFTGSVSLSGGSLTQASGGTISGSALNISSATASLSGTTNVVGGTTLSAATLTSAGNLSTTGLVFGTNSLLNVNSGNALGAGAVTVTGNGSFDNASAGAVTVANGLVLSGGSPTFVGSANLTVGDVAISTANRSLTVNNNTLAIGGISADNSGNRNFSKAGVGTLIVAGTSSYTGTTSVSGGTLVITGSHSGGGTYGIASTGSLTLGVNGVGSIGSAVDVRGTLTGSGSTTGVVTISGSGTLAAGNSGVGTLSTGNLTLATSTAAELVDVDLGSNTADAINVTGAVSIAGSSLTLNGLNVPSLGDFNRTLVLVINDGSDTVNGSFNPTINLGNLAGKYTASVVYSYNADSGSVGNDVALQLSAVPEPTGLMAAAALAGLTLCRRRRKM